MKLYTSPIAPNPTRIRTYLRGKDIVIDEVVVDLTRGEQHSEAHLNRSPLATAPVIEPDNGEFIDESLTFMHHHEQIYPSTVIIGEKATARARTLKTERFIEMNVLQPIVRLIHATNSPSCLPSIPGVATAEEALFPNALTRLNKIIADHTHAMGNEPNIADCTLFAALNFATFASYNIDAQYSNIHRRHESFRTRASTR
ncbi:MAG: glutathione S-transferase [Candidatus Azotimanducaceae bacterium]|jgi:glutathione S-transferase